jgi:hypothetical protein
MIFWKRIVRMQLHKRLNARDLAPRARFELATLRLTAECSTVELPGNCATRLFSFYYSKQIHAMTFRLCAECSPALS